MAIYSWKIEGLKYIAILVLTWRKTGVGGRWC